MAEASINMLHQQELCLGAKLGVSAGDVTNVIWQIKQVVVGPLSV
jgi:hypothetical protein